MTRTTALLTLTLLAVLTACSNLKLPTETETAEQTGKTNAINIGGFWATPKPTFELNSLLESSEDTLKLVTCAEYVYSPFGQLNNKSDLPTGNLNNFKILNRVDTMDAGDIEFQILTLNSSRLILFFDKDPEAGKHSYIFKGDIQDSSVHFIDGIKIGMTKENFIKTFFDNFPSELMTKYNFIVFESCVQDIKHTYSFKDNKLTSINFITDSYWKVTY